MLVYKSRHFKRTVLVLVLIVGMWYLYATKSTDSSRKEVRRDGALTLQDRMQEILAAREWLAQNSARMGYNTAANDRDPYSPNRLFNNPAPRSYYGAGANPAAQKAAWGNLPYNGPFAGGGGDLDHFRRGAQDSDVGGRGGGGGGGGGLTGQQQGGGGGSGGGGGFSESGVQGWGGEMTNMRPQSAGGKAYNVRGVLQPDRSNGYNNGYRAWNTNAYQNQLLNSPFNNVPVNPAGYQRLSPQNAKFQPPYFTIPRQDFGVPESPLNHKVIPESKGDPPPGAGAETRNAVNSDFNRVTIVSPSEGKPMLDKNKQENSLANLPDNTPEREDLSNHPSHLSVLADGSKPNVSRSEANRTIQTVNRPASEVKNNHASDASPLAARFLTANAPNERKDLSGPEVVTPYRHYTETLPSQSVQSSWSEETKPHPPAGFDQLPQNLKPPPAPPSDTPGPQAGNKVPAAKAVRPAEGSFGEESQHVRPRDDGRFPAVDGQPSVQLAVRPILPDLYAEPVTSPQPDNFVSRFLSRFFSDNNEISEDAVGFESSPAPSGPPFIGPAPFSDGRDGWMGNPPPSQKESVAREAGIPLRPWTAGVRSGSGPGMSPVGGGGGGGVMASLGQGGETRGGALPSVGRGGVAGGHPPELSVDKRKEEWSGRSETLTARKDSAAVPSASGDLRSVPMVTRDKTRWKEEPCPHVEGLRLKTLRTPLGDVSLYSEVGSNVIDNDVNTAFGTDWNLHGVGTLFDRCLGTDRNISLVDLGSGMGTVALTAARVVSEVYAIEPMASMAYSMCNTVTHMHYSNVHIIHNAVSDDRGKVFFRKGTKTNSNNTYTVDTRNKSKIDPNAPSAFAIKLDDILRLYKITKAVLRMDVESFEGRALAGANKFLNTVNIPCILMEWKHVHSLKEFGGNYVFDILSTRGFFPHDVNTLLPLKVFRMHEWPPEVLWAKLGSDPVTL